MPLILHGIRTWRLEHYRQMSGIKSESLAIFFSNGKYICGFIYLIYRQTSNTRRTLVGIIIVDNSEVVGAAPVGAASTTSSLYLTLGFNGLGKDNCKTRWETFKLWNSVRLILEILRHIYTYNDTVPKRANLHINDVNNTFSPRACVSHYTFIVHCSRYKEMNESYVEIHLLIIWIINLHCGCPYNANADPKSITYVI